VAQERHLAGNIDKRSTVHAWCMADILVEDISVPCDESIQLKNIEHDTEAKGWTGIRPSYHNVPQFQLPIRST
jgi:hypothetical protein